LLYFAKAIKYSAFRGEIYEKIICYIFT
jgi:hypothetical protein